jgi:hypothetical protein
MAFLSCRSRVISNEGSRVKMKVHFEPYLLLAGLTHRSALIAWGEIGTC